MENPNYYAIIPANVRYDKNLKANEKLLYGEITALSDKYGYCYATNDYFANLYSTSKISISRYVSNLEKKGYIATEIQYKKGTKQIEKRIIRISEYPINKIDNTYYQNKQYPINKIDKENNTSINNININKKEIYKEKYGEFQNVLLSKEEFEKLSPFEKTLIDNLDGYIESTGKKYKSHYATIKMWARKDGEKRPSINQTWEEPKEDMSEAERQALIEQIKGM